jgi:hypothetical protein
MEQDNLIRPCPVGAPADPAPFRLPRWGALVAVALVVLAGALALPPGGVAQQIPSGVGWHPIPNTKLRSVCPPTGFGGSTYDFRYHCHGVTDSWNSAVMDTRRNRLVIWGGGHNDYLGNELYALDLGSLSIKRLTDPGLPVTPSTCPETVAGGTQPNSRHTYDGLAYIEHTDTMFAFGGSLASCGSFSTTTWMYSFETEKWERRKPAGPIPRPDPGVVSAYDPNTKKVLVHDLENLYAYDPAADRYERLSGGMEIDYHMTAVLDPVRRKLLLIGAGQAYVYDVSPGSWHMRRSLRTTGGDPIVKSLYPGMAYDPDRDRIVAWNGGNTVYSLNLETRVWTPITYPGGPGPAHENGTYRRWSYSRASGVFVVVNSVDSDAYALRLPLP